VHRPEPILSRPQPHAEPEVAEAEVVDAAAGAERHHRLARVRAADRGAWGRKGFRW
jgi:hypothetical protein